MENKIKRHYYIDLIRGIAFTLMALDHLLYDIYGLFSSYWYSLFPKTHYLNLVVDAVQNYRNNYISEIIRFVLIAFVFLFISGVSSVFSKNNTKRGIKLLIISLLLTITTVILSLIIKDKSIIIYFGILHCISIAMIATPILKKLNKFIVLLIAIVIIALGLYFENLTAKTLFFIPFNITTVLFTTADYYPLLPYMGFYILGYLGGHYYFEVLKKPRTTKRYNLNIFTYFGKNTLVWYFVHQVALVVILVLFTLVNLLFI